MCGIFCVARCTTKPIESREYYINKSKLLKHRGPDESGIYYDDKIVICHERLSIIGINNGQQPIVSDCSNYILSVNGEIYNYKELLKTTLNDNYICKTQSDCEVIIPLYKEFGISFIKMLDGVFSFVLYDKLTEMVIVGRDPVGVIPLYYSYFDYKYTFSSELKCFERTDSRVEQFPPGNICVLNKTELYWDQDNTYISQFASISNTNIFGKWSIKHQPNLVFFTFYNQNWKYKDIKYDESIREQINTLLTSAVKKRMVSDVPFGVLLSGGLDSSLIASIVNRNTEGKINTFSIGLKDSTDLIAARKVASFLDTEHHEISFTIKDGIDCLRKLIYHLETFDVTTIRASTPMFIMSKYIKSRGIKMVLSGEGADEIFGGYLYFHNAPDKDEFHQECVKRVLELHKFDCLRANKSTMAWGVEARVPFLDKSFLDYCMSIHPGYKNKNSIEKYILRASFDFKKNKFITKPYLPNEILWRQKEQFTDGVGYSWLDSLITHCNQSISDLEFKRLKSKYNVHTKEQAYYRKVFEQLFPNKSGSVDRWKPQTDWLGVGEDPSGRAQALHISNY